MDVNAEIRFESKPDILPDAIFGMIYGELRSQYPKVEKLPILQIPDEIRFKDPHLKFNAYYKLTGSPFVLQIGPRMLSVGCPGEYIGWDKFYSKILETHSIISGLDLIHKVTRLGIRYINFFTFDIFENINLRITLCDNTFESEELALNAQIQDGRFTNRLQVANQVTATTPFEKKGVKGSIIDIDTHLNQGLEDFFHNNKGLLEEGHKVEKKLFFGLLKKEFLLKLNPEY